MKLNTKRMVINTMDIMTLTIVAKGVALLYILGLCGGYENGALTGGQFATSVVITMLFIILG